MINYIINQAIFIYLYIIQINIQNIIQNKIMSEPKQHKKLHQTNSVDIDGTQLLCKHDNQHQNHCECLNNEHDNILQQLLKLYSKNTTKSQKSAKGVNEKDQVGSAHRNQEQQQKYIMPQPLDSEEEHSKQVQYLSYIQNYEYDGDSQSIGSLDADHTKRQKLRGPVRGQFLSILYMCVIYARKEERLTQTDDDQLFSQLKTYFDDGIYPMPKSAIGEALLANGYFLAAYAILFARLHKSRTILTYLLSQFYQGRQKIQENQSQFTYFYNRDRASFNLSEDPEKDMRKSELESYMKDREKRMQRDQQIIKKAQVLKRVRIENVVDMENQQNSKEKINRMKDTRTTINQTQNIKKQPHEMRQGNFFKIKKTEDSK